MEEPEIDLNCYDTREIMINALDTGVETTAFFWEAQGKLLIIEM